MNENKKTLIFIGAAVVLTALALIFRPHPVTPDRFLDQGKSFYPDFTDPNAATTLEVVDFDANTGQPNAFKVTFANNRWVIPSHDDYPADAKDRLAQTAAGVIDIKRDDYRSDNVADFPAFGVVDPLSEDAGLTGRGKRVTIKNAEGEVLSDLIFGNEVPDRPDFRYVRKPDEKRVYASRVKIDISTRFQDWINRDLLELEPTNINQITINDYNINERTRSVENRGKVVLNRSDGKWTIPGLKSGLEVDSTTMAAMVKTLDSLLIVGVRPKPQGLSASLKQSSGQSQLSQDDARSLQSKGFFFTRDGQLMSNDGEMLVDTRKGVQYTLRFGEIVYGSGDESSSDTGQAANSDEAAQNRYLFVTAAFDPSELPEPRKANDTTFLTTPDSTWSDADRANKQLYDAHKSWETQVANGKQKTQELNDRFADWYYVIAEDSFAKLHKTRSELIREKTK